MIALRDIIRRVEIPILFLTSVDFLTFLGEMHLPSHKDKQSVKLNDERGVAP